MYIYLIHVHITSGKFFDHFNNDSASFSHPVLTTLSLFLIKGFSPLVNGLEIK
jgi:hypothetical protein